jgi:hypothetical protein
MTEYRITKEECERQHQGKVCPHCGKPIEALDTLDNGGHPTYWSWCPSCSRLEQGVEPRVFDLATIMYDVINERPYLMDYDSSEETKKRERLGKLCRSVVIVESAKRILAQREEE